ncbi:MAG: methyltransferase domain-containing protein [Limimaricola sp.]|uniref:class I SAM-dependent DNA methyltransferase n=1 Tax=Limimaricola sp. TaxID=2211665 RepID=UPI001E19E2FA|nr:class I SAM-dependent methyltransferase [Limimaricola sp.]MBI1417078.1 methyltransferase domain-containing protein [Limimaricola sp.]
MTDKPSLEGAYGLKTPDDNRRLYRDWAATYDTDFVAAMDYRLPVAVAEAFAAVGAGPVLDVGAGTGAVGMLLRANGTAPVDGTDISPEMLEVAGRSGAYRRLFEGDVLARLDVEDSSYSGIVSAGTFTLGHVGPNALTELLRIAAPGALFVLSINTQHYVRAGFAPALAALSSRIDRLSLPEVPIYGPGATGPHAADRAYVATFRKR